MLELWILFSKSELHHEWAGWVKVTEPRWRLRRLMGVSGPGLESQAVP